MLKRALPLGGQARSNLPGRIRHQSMRLQKNPPERHKALLPDAMSTGLKLRHQASLTLAEVLDIERLEVGCE